MRDDDCVRLLQWALPRLGMRWPGFCRVRPQVCTRITRRIVRLAVEGPAAYRELPQEVRDAAIEGLEPWPGCRSVWRREAAAGLPV
jgi:hypothetical protein